MICVFDRKYMCVCVLFVCDYVCRRDWLLLKFGLFSLVCVKAESSFVPNFIKWPLFWTNAVYFISTMRYLFAGLVNSNIF